MGKPREMTYDTVLGALKVGIGDEFAHGVQDLLELLGGNDAVRAGARVGGSTSVTCRKQSEGERNAARKTYEDSLSETSFQHGCDELCS